MDAHKKLIKALEHADFYPLPTKRVEIVQTHISYIFICDNEVYKIKKPVNFGFLDFTSLAKRKFFCEGEVRLNCRLAENIYLGVVEIKQNHDGKFSFAGDGETIEYAVKMKKIPTQKMLKQLLKEGKCTGAIIEQIARKLVNFHQQAETGDKINEMGSIETISFNHRENFTQTESVIDLTISAHQYNFLKTYVFSFLEKHEKLFAQRVAQGKIRDCHGDLHLEHIICDDSGIFIFDCIEFNERFRCGDVAAEVAFLSMDLDFNGYREFSKEFVSAYVAISNNTEIYALLNFYKCYYAFVRGKVVGFRLNDKAINATERVKAVKLASRYFELAAEYAAKLIKPALIISCGLMGTGKSQLARRLSTHLGAEVITMDILRKETFNIPSQERCYDDFGKGIYDTQTTSLAYRGAFDIAREKLSAGTSVIIDASFKNRELRLAAQKLAQEVGVGFIAILCECPEHIIEERLKRREERKNGASDGRWEIFAKQKASFEEINELSPENFFIVNTNNDKNISTYTVLEEIAKRV